MTLHWWMHWFWVTAQLAVILASPVPSTTEDPRIGEFQHPRNLTSDPRTEAATTPDPQIIERVTSSRSPDELETSTRPNFRVAKAIASYDPTSKSNAATANNPSSGEIDSRAPSADRDRNVNGGPRTRTSPGSMTRRNGADGVNDTSAPSAGPGKRESRITWLLTTSRTPVRRKTEISAEDIIRNFSSASIQEEEEEKDLTVLPLRVEGTRFKLVVNRTRTITADGADGFSTRTFNGSEDIEIDQELAEPRLAATAASILQAGISESTRLSRARNTFSSDFQGDREEDRSSLIDVSNFISEDESVNTEIESSTPSAVDIAAITGSCLATVVLLSTMASLGFIMYRRKYLNPPQTLNSDKCSNPDSSGYIDDSTIRDNSEEMYSLDNDSFLNSLEAMTIQNYWTDSVKHTKL